MATYNATSRINLEVNGSQANKIFNQLKKEAEQLRKKIDEAALAGDKVAMKKLQQDLNNNKRLMQQLSTETASVEQTLSRLDRASPKELNKTLNSLRKQLNNIERGSEAWKKQVEMIKRVKAEIDKVNASLRNAESRWNRMNRWLNDCQTALMGMVAAASGLIMAGRSAVNKFAQMDEQLANTRKYTGLAAESVAKLNDAFKNTDTRTTREKLNELAQEAGRLGKNTLDSVKGYTEAADIINVALVDLGAGATQSIAKLTNIFGVEQMLGTKEAMLAVGSTVNVLSQNCTASKPYLVEFAQRMAGIGSQAGLTIPQILAFGAVLDANGQKVEMSATAIQKVIMNLANKNKEFAKVVGLDAKELNRTLKFSAKDGLLMFLEALQNMGKSVGFNNATMTLAPAFKDMGLDAARVSQVLSTLAMHLDEVKWQLGEADKAFREASSATREYEIFNNTAQAAIDKAKKKFGELAIELGEKLYPVMKHIYTSSGLFIRFLNTVVSFLVNYRVEIVSVTSAIIAYNVAIRMAAVRTGALNAVQLVNKAIVAGSKVSYAAFGVVVSILTGNINRARAAWRLLNMTLSTSPVGLVVAAVSALVVALVQLVKNTESYTKKADKLIGKSLEVKEAVVKEQTEIAKLFGVLKGARESTEEYANAKDQLIKQYGRYLSGLIDEKGNIIDLAKAYDVLSESVARSARERGLANAKEELQNDHIQNQTSHLARLQNALVSYGADPMTASSVVTKVAMAAAEGKAVDGATLKLLEQFSKGNPSLDNSTGEELSAVQGFFAKLGVGFKADSKGLRGRDVDSPLQIYSSLRDDQRDFDKGVANIEAMALGVNSTVNYQNQTLLKALDDLNDVIQSNVIDAVDLPNIFIPDNSVVVPKGVLTEEGRKQYAARVSQNYVSSRKNNYVLASSANPDTGNLPGFEIDGFNAPVVVNLKDADLFSGKGHTNVSVTPAQAKIIKEKIEEELRLRGVSFGNKVAEDEKTWGSPYSSSGSDASSRSDRFRKEDEYRRIRRAYADINLALGFSVDRKSGKSSLYTSFNHDKDYEKIDVAYYKKILERDDLSYTERLEMTAKFNEARKKLAIADAAQAVDLEQKRHDDLLVRVRQFYADSVIDKDTYDTNIRDEEERHLGNMRDIYKKASRPDAKAKAEIAQEERRHKKLLETVEQFFKAGVINQDEYDTNIRDEKERHNDNMLAIEKKFGTDYKNLQNSYISEMYKKYKEYDSRYKDLAFRNFEQKQKELDQKAQEFRKKYDKKSEVENLNLELKILDQLYKYKKISETEFQEWPFNIQKAKAEAIPGNSNTSDSRRDRAKEAKARFEAEKKFLDSLLQSGDISMKDYERRMSNIQTELRKTLFQGIKDCRDQFVSATGSMLDAWLDFYSALKNIREKDDLPFEELAEGIRATAAVASAVFQQVTSYSEAQLKIQTAAIEKRYDREIELAEGNAYLTRKYEKQKEEEIAKLKKESSEKEFKMQLAQAIAQTAANALEAFSAGLDIGGPAGFVLGGIFAAAALAMGAVQIATIKKQQQAAAAVGYSEGGFTRPGRVDEPAGIVHAGEWVASQKLVNSPNARPLIEYLEYAQRNNRIGSISMQDVSRSVAAPMFNAFAPEKHNQVVVHQQPAVIQNSGSKELSSAISDLVDRLKRPFVTVNSVTGEGGINEAEKKYNRMIRNKSRRVRS